MKYESTKKPIASKKLKVVFQQICWNPWVAPKLKAPQVQHVFPFNIIHEGRIQYVHLKISLRWNLRVHCWREESAWVSMLQSQSHAQTRFVWCFVFAFCTKNTGDWSSKFSRNTIGWVWSCFLVSFDKRQESTWAKSARAGGSQLTLVFGTICHTTIFGGPQNPSFKHQW